MTLHAIIIDNYDSFTYNVAQALSALGARVTVLRNDEVGVEELEQKRPDRLVISPGPGGPRGGGISLPALLHFRKRIPVLGICLGHQVLAEAFGAVVRPTPPPVHGKPWPIHHDGRGIFAGIPTPFIAARYHSLAVDRESLSPSLRLVAWTEERLAMGLGIEGEATWGVQFHPESFMTPLGDRILAAFLEGRICSSEECDR